MSASSSAMTTRLRAGGAASAGAADAPAADGRVMADGGATGRRAAATSAGVGTGADPGPASALAVSRRRPARSQPSRTDRLARVRRKPRSPAAAPVAQRQRQWSQTPSSVGSNPTRGTRAQRCAGGSKSDPVTGRFESDPGYERESSRGTGSPSCQHGRVLTRRRNWHRSRIGADESRLVVGGGVAIRACRRCGVRAACWSSRRHPAGYQRR